MTIFNDSPNRNWAESLIEGDVREIPDELDETALEEEDETDGDDTGNYEEDDEVDRFIERQLNIDA